MWNHEIQKDIRDIHLNVRLLSVEWPSLMSTFLSSASASDRHCHRHKPICFDPYVCRCTSPALCMYFSFILVTEQKYLQCWKFSSKCFHTAYQTPFSFTSKSLQGLRNTMGITFMDIIKNTPIMNWNTDPQAKSF